MPHRRCSTSAVFCTPREWTPALVVPREGIHHRWRPGEFVGQDHAVDQRAVRSWPRFGAMAWAASPSKTRRPENQRRQSTRRTVLTSRSSKDDTSPIGLLRPEVPVATPGGRPQGRVQLPRQPPHPHGLQPRSRRDRPQRRMAEGSQRGPILFEPRAGPTTHDRAYVAAPRRHPTRSHPCGGRIDSVGTHNDVGPHAHRAGVRAVLRRGAEPHRAVRVGAHRGTPKTPVHGGHAGDGVKQQPVKVGPTDSDRVIQPAAQIRAS